MVTTSFAICAAQSDELLAFADATRTLSSEHRIEEAATVLASTTRSADNDDSESVAFVHVDIF